MISCISPSIYDLAQTRQTLDYAMATGTIKNKATSIGLKSFINKEDYEQLILKSIIASKRIVGKNSVKDET